MRTHGASPLAKPESRSPGWPVAVGTVAGAGRAVRSRNRTRYHLLTCISQTTKMGISLGEGFALKPTQVLRQPQLAQAVLKFGGG